MPGTACGLSTARSQFPASVLSELDVHGPSPLRPANGSAEVTRVILLALAASPASLRLSPAESSRI